MKIWAFCVFMPQKLQDMSSFLGFGGNSALLQTITDQEKEIVNLKAEVKSYATVQKILDGLDKKSKK